MTQHYCIRNILLYPAARRAEDSLYIPRGHCTNGATLRELVIEEIHNKGHHSTDRNLRYTTEHIWWLEIRKDLTDYVQQFELCQHNKEWTTLPTADMMTFPFPSEIFSSYAIDFMGPFMRLTGYNTALAVVDRAVEFG